MIEDNCWLEAYEAVKILVMIGGKEEAGMTILNGLFNNISDEMYSK